LGLDNFLWGNYNSLYFLSGNKRNLADYGGFIMPVLTCDECGRRFDWDSSPKLVDNGLKIFPKHFCSAGCKRSYMAAKKGGGGESSSGGSSGGNTTVVHAGPTVGQSIASGIGDYAKADADAYRQNVANINQEKQDLPAKLESIRLDGTTADEISNALNDLFALYSSIPSGVTEMSLMNVRSAVKKGALEKSEFGIVKLRKIDPDMADFFQKKLEDFKAPKGVIGFAAKMFKKK
jgi:hypothetical protein